MIYIIDHDLHNTLTTIAKWTVQRVSHNAIRTRMSILPLVWSALIGEWDYLTPELVSLALYTATRSPIGLIALLTDTHHTLMQYATQPRGDAGI